MSDICNFLSLANKAHVDSEYVHVTNLFFSFLDQEFNTHSWLAIIPLPRKIKIKKELPSYFWEEHRCKYMIT